MLFLIVLLMLALVIDIAAMRWGYDSRDKLESKEWERRNKQVWSGEHPIFRPTKSVRVLHITRPSLNHAHVSEPYGVY
jgi:hypothetical protein